jgi:imidazolonepropionase-like amidohydrolase
MTVLSRRMICSLASVFAMIAVNSSRGDFETPIALTGVKIVTGTGATIESGTIVMLDGRIVAVGTDVGIPPQAERIDGSGLIAYPGFIDALTNLGIPEKERTKEERERTEDLNPDPREGPLPATRFADRRGIRPQTRGIEQYVPDDKQREAHRAAGFTAALIAPRDGLLGGSSDLVGLSNDPIRRAVIESNVAQHGSFTVGEPGDYPQNILGVFAQFRQVLLDARRQAKLQKYYERHPNNAIRPPTDAALDALQPMLGRSQRIFFEANTDNEIRRALDLSAEFKLDVAITGAKEAWQVIDRIKAERVPLIVSLKFDEEPEYGKKKPKSEAKKPDGKATETGDASVESKEGAETKDAKKDERIYEPLKLRKERRRLWEEQAANVIRLHEAGVPFALTTRSFKKISEFMESLRLVIEKGLPEEAAIAALTLNAAEVLGMKGQLGAIAAGYVANVTVMTKPLSDKAGKVKFVFIDGKKIEIEAEDEKEKGDKDKKPDGGEGSKSAETAAAKTEEKAGETVAPDEKEDKDPTWAVEIKTDRIPKTKTGGSVLVKNATILPVTGPTILNGSVLIRNGKIAAVGTDVAAPTGVTVIDAAGRFVMPGIIDPHSHLAIDGVNEGTMAISAEVRVADTIDPHDITIYRTLAGGDTTHHAMHGSANPIGGQNVVFKLKYERPVSEMVIADAPRSIKFALGENVTQANFFENFGKRYPNTRMGVEATIRTAFEAAKEYQRGWDDYNRQSQSGQDVPPPRRDLRLEALADVLAGRMTVHNHCYRSEEILRIFAVAEEYGIRIGTLDHVLEGYRVAPEIARHGAGATTFANDWAYKVEAYGAIPHNAALMTQRGVNASLNSDSPNTTRYLNQEAAKCIKWGGLDENQALRLVTLNPAMQLQIDERVGSIEVGKDGDLAIFNGHPLNTFSKCVMTLIDGEVYFEDPRPDPVEALTDWKAGPAFVDRTIPQTPHRAYAIVGATIHPISGPVIERGTVVIVEDKILEVGPNATVPPGAGVIDGSGLHVYPGLIDASGILGLNEIDSLRSTRDFSEIGTFNPQLKAASAVHSHSEHIRIARTAGITTALVRPSGGRISGQSAVIHLDGWTAPDMLVVDTFGLHMNVPSLPVHLSEDKEAKKKQTDEHKKALKQLEDYIAKAKHYAEVKQLAAADTKIRYEVDLTLEAMIPYVRGEKPVIFEGGTYKPILDAIEFAEKHKLKCVLSGGAESWKLADVLKQKDIPVILATVLSYPRGEYETWDSVYRCAAELDRAGVKFCFGSESASGAFDLGSIVGMAVAHGLPRERAEYALTLGAAEILGIADRVGSIEPGKRADLIVTTDTPLQTVAQVTHMFIDGRPIELTSMQTESYEKFKNRPAPKLPPMPDVRGPKSLTAH